MRQDVCQHHGMMDQEPQRFWLKFMGYVGFQCLEGNSSVVYYGTRQEFLQSVFTSAGVYIQIIVMRFTDELPSDH